jgi:hypothetical protein
MVEFDRTAAILFELNDLDDRFVAHLAGISFHSDNDCGVIRDLRESLAREYRNGNAGRRDWYETAAIVAQYVARRGDQFLRFAAVTDIGELRMSPSPYDEEEAIVVGLDDTIAEVVDAALRFRFKRAAYQLVASLEDIANHQATQHDNRDGGNTEADDAAGELPIF